MALAINFDWQYLLCACDAGFSLAQRRGDAEICFSESSVALVPLPLSEAAPKS